MPAGKLMKCLPISKSWTYVYNPVSATRQVEPRFSRLSRPDYMLSLVVQIVIEFGPTLGVFGGS